MIVITIRNRSPIKVVFNQKERSIEIETMVICFRCLQLFKLDVEYLGEMFLNPGPYFLFQIKMLGKDVENLERSELGLAEKHLIQVHPSFIHANLQCCKKSNQKNVCVLVQNHVRECVIV